MSVSESIESHVEQAVRSLYQALLQSWNEQDAVRFAQLFTEQGTSIGYDGSLMVGPKEIEPILAAIFKAHPTATYVSKIREVRSLSNGVVLLRSVVGMVPRGGGELNPQVNAVQTLIAQDIDGEWKIVHFQNTPAAYHGRSEESIKLTNELNEVLGQNK